MHRSFLPSCAGFMALLSPLVAAAQQAGAARPETYFEFQVDKPAEPLPGGVTPYFPAGMRATRTSGEVIAQFVVDTAGIADMGSFRILRSTHADYTASVRDVVPHMRFRPAELQGRRVYQLVQMPFVFNIAPAAGTSVDSMSIETVKEPGVPAPPPAAQASTVPALGGVVVYEEDDVTTKPSPRRGNRAPRYPARLREQFVQGEVLTQFVITDEGKVAPGSFVVLRTSHPDFVPAVREAALGLRFNPAELNGRKVHSRVKMPFVFKLDRGNAPPPLRRRPGSE